MLRSLRLRTNYVIRVMRIKDKGDKALALTYKSTRLDDKRIYRYSMHIYQY